MKVNALIIDDEKPIRDMICFALRQANFACRQAADAETACQIIRDDRPDIILLDWMLARSSGIDFAKKLSSRDVYREIPIIMLTAKAEENDKLKGFSAGCDDYITKPFSTRELVARIKAVIRRTVGDNDILSIGKLTFDAAGHRVTLDNREIHMSPTEYRLLKFFMTHAERVYSRAQLLDYVWSETTHIDERTVDVHIRRLRKTLAVGNMDNLIQTVHGTGYRLSAKTGRSGGHR